MAGIKLKHADIPTQDPVQIGMTLRVVAKERYETSAMATKMGTQNDSLVGRRTCRILLNLSDLGTFPVLISCFDFRRFHETTARSLQQVYSRHESLSENGREKTSWALFLRVFAIVSMIMFPSKRARGHTGTKSMISLFVFLVQEISGQM